MSSRRRDSLRQYGLIDGDRVVFDVSCKNLMEAISSVTDKPNWSVVKKGIRHTDPGQEEIELPGLVGEIRDIFSARILEIKIAK